MRRKKRRPQTARRPQGSQLLSLRVSERAVEAHVGRSRLVASRLLLLRAFRRHPLPVVEAEWNDPSYLVAERDRLSELTVEEFYRTSTMIGTALLRDEVDHYVYFAEALRLLRSIRPAEREVKCAVMGLSAGAEVELAYHAGYVPWSTTPRGPTRDLMEARLLATRTPHGTIEIDHSGSLTLTTWKFHRVLVTHRPGPTILAWLQGALMPDGVVVFPRSLIGLYGDLQDLGWTELPCEATTVLAVQRR